MKTLLAIFFLGFVFSSTAQQLNTNQPARFKTKVVVTGSGDGTSVGINFVPDAISPGNENVHTGTSPGKEFELKWKYLGRKGDKDVYRFVFTRHIKAGATGQTADSKEVLFDGHKEKVFEDDLHTVTIDSPSEEDLARAKTKSHG